MRTFGKVILLAGLGAGILGGGAAAAAGSGHSGPRVTPGLPQGTPIAGVTLQMTSVQQSVQLPGGITVTVKPNSSMGLKK